MKAGKMACFHAVISSAQERRRTPGAAATTRRLFLTTVSAAALTAVSAGPAAAQTWNGSVSTDWTNAANWTGGVPTAGSITEITTGAPNPAVLGVGGAAVGTNLRTFVGQFAGTTGNLTIQNGSTLTTSSLARIGENTGATGVATVTGAATWNINSVGATFGIMVGNLGTGTLNITNGGTVNVNGGGQTTVGDNTGGHGTLNVSSGGRLNSSGTAQIGRASTSVGTATISDAGSQWNVAGQLVIGNASTGTLNVQNGAEVIAQSGVVMASQASASGTLNVNSGGILGTQFLQRGAGSAQANFDGGVLRATASTTSFITGFTGTQLNIASGGLTVDTAGFNVTASSPLSGTGTFTKVGAGTLTLTGANSTNFSGVMAINAGTLSVAAASNLGTGGLSFNGGTLQNTGAFTTALPVTLNAGGGTFQTDGNLTLGGIIGGTGALTKSGGSALTLTGANTYTGQTWIQSGILALSGSGAIANSSRVVADGTFDISAVTPTSANIQSLAGAGAVALGQKILTLTNANDTFAGSITGVGNGTLEVSGGTQTLTGTSTIGYARVSGTGELRLESGGKLTTTSSIDINGPNVSATVSGAGSRLEGTALFVRGGVNGFASTLNIVNGGVVKVTNGSTTLGSASSGTVTLNVDGAGSRLEIGSIGVGNGNGAPQIFVNVTNGGTITSGTVTVGNSFLGGPAKAVTISGGGSNWTMSGDLALRYGTFSVLNGGTASSTNATIGSQGPGALLVAGAGSTYLVSGNQLIGTGTYTGTVTLADGGRMGVGGALTLASDATSTGILNIGGAEGHAATGAGILNAATLVFGPGTGRLNFNHTDTNYLFSTVVSGAGTINHTGPGRTNFTSNSSAFTGSTFVSGGTLAVNGSLCGPMNVLAGGTLGGNGTVCDTTNAGTVAPGNSIGTLTVNGNYVGSGGVLAIESVLGGDASPTDKLVVTGNTSGNTNVRVINLGGSGAQTVEGIKVVDVGGASNGTFILQGNYVLQGQQAVVGGAYAYTLQKNGVSTPADGDWYLRSSLINPPPHTPAGPLYQPGVPLYENYAQVLLGLTDLPSLQQRVGNRYWGGSAAMARAGVNTAQTDPTWTQSAFWGRIEGGQASLQPSNTIGSTYNADQVKAQTGLDGVALDNDRGRLIVGLTAQYGLTTAYVNSFFGNGRIRAQGTGVGATATWYGHDGFYVDGQAQTMFYRSDLSSVLAGSMTHGNAGFGYAFSVESGKRIGVGNGFWLAPQAQLAYSKVDFDSFTDRFGALVSLRNADSLLGRVGLSLNHQRTWNDGSGIVRSDVYAIGNLHYEFLNGTNIDVAGTGFASANDRLWGSIGGGGTYSWASGRYAVFGEVTYRASLDNAADNHSYKGTGGFRVTW